MITFDLLADYEGDVEIEPGVIVPKFTGGAVHLGDGRAFDVREELEAGGGIIAVEPTDYLLLNALTEYPALKRVESHADDVEPTVGKYDGLNAAALRAEAQRRELATAGSKADLVERLTAHDAAVAAGDGELAANPNPEAGNDDVAGNDAQEA